MPLPHPGARATLRAVVSALSLAVLVLGARPAASDPRVEDLLARMTLEEKVGQLNLQSHGPTLNWDDLATGRVGALINFNNPQDIAKAQALARRSRLKIPFLFGLDILHGFRTIFPVPLGETATFDPALARLASEWAAREAAYVGVQWTYAPMADVSRDPRWGRIVEGSGEDPYLGSVFAAARVAGFKAGGLATAPKHFVGYGGAVAGRDYDAAFIPETELRDTYLPPFRAAIEAGAETVMSSFVALNGVPATAHPWLLTDVLRKEWRFSGFVVSDWGAIEELLGHGVAGSEAEAARKAFLAGVDMDLMSGLYDRHLADEVRAGRVPEAAVDRAVRRVLGVKARLGLFDRPDADPTRNDAGFPTPASREAALAVARESIVLLTNRDRALPLSSSVRSLAVVGPLAGSRRDLLGPHGARAHAEDTRSLVEVMGERAASAGIRFAHAPGCDLHCRDADGFRAALAAAEAADAVIAVMGEPQDLSGEAATRAHLSLGGRQPELLDALLKAGKPVILVLVAGRPLEITPFVDRAFATLMAWYPGTEGAAAVADVLFGAVNPSGKLPVTWPRTVGQVPLAYDRLPSGRPPAPGNRFRLGYVDERLEPLFPFGWGLSYTSFAYGAPTVVRTDLKASDVLEVEVEVANTGERPGREAVQLYVRQPVASRSRPLRQLKAIEKVTLAPGEARRVRLTVPVRALGFHREDGTYTVEPGRFEVFVGPNAAAERGTEVVVAEGLSEKPGAPR